MRTLSRKLTIFLMLILLLINSNMFALANTLTLPESLTIIEDKAFLETDQSKK